MTRLDEKILSLKNASKKALVAYLVAGDPDLNSTLELMHGFVDAGVDILEVGVPFTDPIAEGPIIQAAHDRALKNNISLTDIFTLIKSSEGVFPLCVVSPSKYKPLLPRLLFKEFKKK